MSTLNATREQVAEMQIVCQDKAVIVAQAKKECEEILVEIVTEKRIVDEQEIKVREQQSYLWKKGDETMGLVPSHEFMRINTKSLKFC